MKVKIKENINLKDLAENNWEGCRSDTLSFLDNYYGREKIFEVFAESRNYYIINGYLVNKKCFEEVPIKEMTVEEISEVLGYEVKVVKERK